MHDKRLIEVREVFLSTLHICATLWTPPLQSETTSGKGYSRVPGFRERKNHNKHPWDARTVFVFKYLFEWREIEARIRGIII
jgi:hypothetical protein